MGFQIQCLQNDPNSGPRNASRNNSTFMIEFLLSVQCLCFNVKISLLFRLIFNLDAVWSCSLLSSANVFLEPSHFKNIIVSSATLPGLYTVQIPCSSCKFHQVDLASLPSFILVNLSFTGIKNIGKVGSPFFSTLINHS